MVRTARVGSAPGEGQVAKLGSIHGWDAKSGSVSVAAVQQSNRHFCWQPAGRSTAMHRAGAPSPHTPPELGAWVLERGGCCLISHGFPHHSAWAGGARRAHVGQASKTVIARATGTGGTVTLSIQGLRIGSKQHCGTLREIQAALDMWGGPRGMGWALACGERKQQGLTAAADHGARGHRAGVGL